MIDTKIQYGADRLLELTKNSIDKSPKHFTTNILLGLNGKTPAEDSSIKVAWLIKW